VQPFTSHTGRVLPLPRSDVDTDQIIPAEFCKRITRTGFDDALFANWRSDPEFVLNQPQRQGASVLVAGPSFGVGSSREHAVWALQDWGIAVVLAPSFGDIFARNALRGGLLVAPLPEPAVTLLLEQAERDPGFEVTADLERSEVRTAVGRWPLEIEPRRRELLLGGLDDIELTLAHGADLDRYESGRAPWLPSLRRGATGPRQPLHPQEQV
jgi:3-isopropylmalate/(R)-2-methylmalate dehydratase small subunit